LLSSQQLADLEKLLARSVKTDDLLECFNFANLLQTNFGNVSDLFVSPQHKTAMVRVQQLDPISGLSAFKFIGRLLVECALAAEKNIDAMYKKYSVINVLHWFAVLRTFKTYSGKYNEVVATDNSNRDAYINQGVDPSYVQEALPLIKKDLNFLPHQAKISNLTRKSPKVVVLPVDAGGGKTITILTDILRELKKKTVKRPIIVCPAHLVAQYIEEVIYVTEGKLNLIPITNSTLKAHGEDRLKNFILKSPPNSIVITDMHFLASREERVAYGNKTLPVFRNVEFLRQFEFDCVSIDEVHFLKNVKSNRRAASARFMIDIPMKRIASGTLISDTMLDLVSQIALLDPSLFGSEERFKREWADEVKGNKVISWKPGAEKEVRNIIQQHAVVASAKRKEWAALLPPSEETFLAVELSDSQRLLYESILKETIDLIAEAALKNDELKALLEQDDDDGSALEAKLRPYLARLEKFLSAPNDDAAASLFLKQLEEQVSPKLKKAYERCELHLARKLPGKILLFTQYTSTAEAFFEYAPQSLREKIIHYTADKKLECRFEFESNPEKSIMIGVSSSMDTGLNLQHVSRLIRLESVWTPGVLEQGNSRLNRPQLKKAEERNVIFFDTILVNRTIDVTKIARLTSKIVSKAKFDEFDNQDYQDLQDLPRVALTLDSIAENNDFANTLLPYLERYQEFKKVQKEDYAQYVKENGDTLLPTPIPSSGLLEGSKLMSRIPYVPGMIVYGTAQLGLIRYDQFLRQDIDTIDDSAVDAETSEDENDENDIDENDPKALFKKQLRDKRIKERLLLKDKPVHTDFGDGIITGLGNKYVRVRLANGTRIRLLKLQTFIITRATTNNKDLRNELLKQVGDLPLDAPIEVPVEQGAEDTKRSKKKNSGVETTVLSGEFQFTILNDFLSVQYVSDEISDSLLRVLQNLGFKTSPDYAFTKVANARNLLLLFRTWKDKGFTISRAQSTLFKDIFEAIKGNRAALRSFGLATQLDFTLFYREQIKPSTDPNAIKIYPLIQDGILYLIAPTKGQTGNLKAVRTMSQGIKWKKAGGNTELLKFVKTKGEAKQVVKNILNAGVTITNLKEMGETFKSIKLS
jgi:superfamily II DNA or RNA helicase